MERRGKRGVECAKLAFEVKKFKNVERNVKGNVEKLVFFTILSRAFSSTRKSGESKQTDESKVFVTGETFNLSKNVSVMTHNL